MPTIILLVEPNPPSPTTVGAAPSGTSRPPMRTNGLGPSSNEALAGPTTIAHEFPSATHASDVAAVLDAAPLMLTVHQLSKL